MAITKVTGALVDIGDLDLTNVGTLHLDSIVSDASPAVVTIGHLGSPAGNDTLVINGNVGIGETAPDRIFHVKRSDSAGTVAKFENSAGTVYIELNTDNQAGGDAGYLSYDSSKNLGLWTDDGQRVTINSVGNVGIGAAPQSTYTTSSYPAIELKSGMLIGGPDNASTALLSNAYLHSDGNWKRKTTAAAANYTQNTGKHYFYHSASDSADTNITFSQLLRIDSDGVKFGSDTAAANALDDYEEGAWTPTAHQGTASFTSVHSARYVKIGNMCYCQAYVVFPASSDSSGYAAMSLPFSAAAVTNTHWGGPLVYANHGLDVTSCMTFQNQDYVLFRNYKTGVVATRSDMSGKTIIAVVTFKTV